MKSFIRFIYLIFLFFSVESQAVYTRHKYDGSDYSNHLSKFFQTINDTLSKKYSDVDLFNLVDIFMNSTFYDREDQSPLNFYEDSSNQQLSSEFDTDKGTHRENKFAECTIYDDNTYQRPIQKFYMPLRDAQTFAANFESNFHKFASNEKPFKVLNLSSKDSNELNEAVKKVSLKCTAVDAKEVNDTCKACLYFEEVVLKSHFRYGHLVGCGVMECMNGFDRKLVSSDNKGYFFLDFVKFHPICLA